VIPMHYGTFPPLVGRPVHLKALLGPGGPEVVEMQAGQTLGQKEQLAISN